MKKRILIMTVLFIIFSLLISACSVFEESLIEPEEIGEIISLDFEETEVDSINISDSELTVLVFIKEPGEIFTPVIQVEEGYSIIEYKEEGDESFRSYQEGDQADFSGNVKYKIKCEETDKTWVWTVSVNIFISEMDSLIAWYDASQLDYNNGDNVEHWEDISHNENVVSQSDQVYQPEFIENELNNRPVVRFSGNQILEADTSLFDGETALTTFVVYKTDNISGLQFLWLDNNDGGMTGQWFKESNSQYRTRLRLENANSDAIVGDFLPDDGQVRLYEMSWSTDSYLIKGYINDGSAIETAEKDNSGDGTQIASSQIFAIGGGSDGAGDRDYYITGDIAEIIAFNSELSDSTRAEVENYLVDKWGIGIE